MPEEANTISGDTGPRNEKTMVEDSTWEFWYMSQGHLWLSAKWTIEGDKCSWVREGWGPEQPRKTARPWRHQQGCEGRGEKPSEEEVKAGGLGTKFQGSGKIPVLAQWNGGCSIHICENLREGFFFRNKKVIKILREITWSNVVCIWVIRTKLKLANYIRSTDGENRTQGR